MAAEWFFSQNRQREGPVPLETIQSKLVSGELKATDLVWRQGMPDWMPASQIPELGAAAPLPVMSVGTVAYAQPHGDAIICTPRAVEMLRRTKPWARLISIVIFVCAGLMVIGGGFMLAVGRNSGMPFLGGIYIALSCLYFAPGIYLNRYATRIGEMLQLRHEAKLEEALEAQKSFWKFCGITATVILSIYAIALIIALVVAIIR